MKQNYQEDKKHIELDNYFQKSLKNIEPEYNENLWQDLESKLDKVMFPQVPSAPVDDFVRQKLNHIQPTYEENAWDNLEKQLDEIDKINAQNDKAFDTLIKEKLTILQPTYEENAWDNFEKQLDEVDTINAQNDKAFDNLIRGELTSLYPTYEESAWNNLEKQLNEVDNFTNPEDTEFDNLIRQELNGIQATYQENIWDSLEKQLNEVDSESKISIFKLKNWQKIAATLALLLLGSIAFLMVQDSLSDEKSLSKSKNKVVVKKEYKETDFVNTENNKQSLKSKQIENKNTYRDNEISQNDSKQNNVVANSSGNKHSNGNILNTTNHSSFNTKSNLVPPTEIKKRNDLNENIPQTNNITQSVIGFEEVHRLKVLLLEEENNITQPKINNDSIDLPKSHRDIQYLLGVSLGQQINHTLMAQTPNQSNTYGIYGEIRYKNKIALSTSAHYSLVSLSFENGFNQPVTSEAGNFINKLEYTPQISTFDEVTVQSDVVEVPIDIKYIINHKSKYKTFIILGTSSHFYLKQQFTYHLDFSQQVWANESTAVVRDISKQVGFYPFSHLNLALGIENSINQNYSLTFQPYYKIPLGKVGLEQIYQDTFGVRALLLFKI